jgi:LuxR family maltose regulon positive regulatory protein
MPRIAACADACAARMAIGKGNLMATGEWSERRQIRPDEPFSLLFAMECLTQARLYFARGHCNDALNLLETLLNRCKKRGLLEFVLQINILQSAVLHATNRLETAAAILKKALAFSEIEGYVCPFASDAKLIAPVLKHIAANKPRDMANDHLSTTLKACEINISGPMVPEEFIVDDHEKLTRREVEILGWIAQGFQNKEIAEKAYIAITTVKSHVSNILVKLNVKTRTQAVLKAREMVGQKQGGFVSSDKNPLGIHSIHIA